MSTETRAFPITPRLIVGLLVVAFGLALTLDNLGMFDAGDLIRYWPFGLIAIGVAKILQDQSRSSRIGGAIFILVGGLIAAEEFLFISIDVWRWWPLAIVFFGMLILWKAFRAASDAGEASGTAAATGAPLFGIPAVPRPGTMEQTMSEIAIWSGLQRRVSSPAFKHANLTAIMGGIEFDLRQAGAHNGEAVIDVFVLWGGIEIVVPPDWSVSNQVTPIMGGAEDRSTGTQQSRNRLVVKGVVLMGGVDIKL